MRERERASEQYVYELHKNQVQNHMNIEQCNERIGIGTSPTFQHMHNARIHLHKFNNGAVRICMNNAQVHTT